MAEDEFVLRASDLRLGSEQRVRARGVHVGVLTRRSGDKGRDHALVLERCLDEHKLRGVAGKDEVPSPALTRALALAKARVG